MRQLGLGEATAGAPPAIERRAEAQRERRLAPQRVVDRRRQVGRLGVEDLEPLALAAGLEVRTPLARPARGSDRGGGRAPRPPRRPRPAARARTGARSPAAGSAPPRSRSSAITSDWSTSEASRSSTRSRSIPSPAQTSSAASSVKPPAKTARRRSSACSSVGEQLVAPVDRRAQGLLARQRRARPAGQQPEAVREPACDLLDRRASAPARRPARSPAASRRARWQICGHRLARSRRSPRSPGAPCAPARRTAAPRRDPATLSGSRRPRSGQRQRRHPPVGLAGHPERRAARGQHHDVRARPAAAPRPPRRRLPSRCSQLSRTSSARREAR